MTEKQKSYVALATICIIWGVTWVISKHAITLGNLPPLQLCGYRQLIAGFCFCGYFFYKGLGFPKATEWKRIIILSLLMFVLSNGLSTLGVADVGSGLGSIIGAIVALWLALFGFIVLKQPVSNKIVLGLVVGFMGILIIFYDKLNMFTNSKFTLSIIFSLVATVTWALGSIYTMKYAKVGNAWYNVGWQMLVSGIIMTALSYTQHHVALHEIKMVGWVDLFILTLFGSIITFICYMYVLKKLPAAQVSIYVYINPIIAVLLGHVVFPEEKLSATLGFGALVTLLGVYIVNSVEKNIE